MSLSSKYLEALSRLPAARPLNEFSPHMEGVFLRHDVDHDLDLALEMAFWEREAGHRATYFILHTADYTKDERFLLKLRQIQEFGHEVGIHLNFLASWIKGEIGSVEQSAGTVLASWRASGLRVTGCAAHGDRSCYEHNFVNYWMFRELRPTDPAIAETGLSPEGIRDGRPGRGVVYPPAHVLRRSDGECFPLWSVSLKQMGLDYHATHLGCDRYYSDSGGEWVRTASPFQSDLRSGSHQILMHPEYYRGDPRRIFVVSTARSGSKWLAQLAASATPCHSVHEFSLNHRYDQQGGLVAEKRTHSGFVRLQHDDGQSLKLLLHTRKYVDDLKQDFFECSIYLAHFLPQLRLLFPEATVIALHRNPKDIVRSILNRGWYDTPEDDRHPEIDHPRWADADQFERACLYVSATSAAISALAEKSVKLENIVSAPDNAAAFFREIGIPFYPLLAREDFHKRVNASRGGDSPSSEQWSERDRAAFTEICSPVLQALGYSPCMATLENHSSAVPQDRIRTAPERETTRLFDLADRFRAVRPSWTGVQVQRVGSAIRVTGDIGKNGRVLLGGGRWGRLIPFLHGWRSDLASYFKVRCRADIARGQIALHALFYDSLGRLLYTRLISRVSTALPESAGTFRVNDSRCRWINVALYFAKTLESRHYDINEVEISQIRLVPGP